MQLSASSMANFSSTQTHFQILYRKFLYAAWSLEYIYVRTFDREDTADIQRLSKQSLIDKRITSII